MNNLIGEFFGTMMLIVLGDGVVAAVLLSKSKAQNSGWIVITAGWAFAVMVGVFASVALGGPGHLNPAVTIAQLLRGNTDVTQAISYIIAQFVGAFVGGVLVFLAYYAHWAETDNKGFKLGIFCTGPAIRSPVWNLVTEIIGTFVLVFGVYAIFGKAVGAIPAGLGPFLVAGLVWGIGLSLGGPTGYAINPARDLGPRIAHFVLPIAGKGDSDWGYSWIPVVGPIIGGIIAAVLAGALTM
ncbi:MAG: aquaporin family protein [Chloroflexi bacterium]|nr:aquaporin family protein [Chloroflexota bacterium]